MEESSHYASINSKGEHCLGNQGFAPIFSLGPGDLYHLNCPEVRPIIKVPSCQLMPHESTFQLPTDLPSDCCSLVTKSASKLGENFKTFKYGT